MAPVAPLAPGPDSRRSERARATRRKADRLADLAGGTQQRSEQPDDDRLKAVFLALLADFVVRPSQFQGLGIPAINPEPAFERRIDLAAGGIPQPSYRNIVGGCDALVRVVVREIEARGGSISCGAEVKRIRVEDNRGTGVELGDGTVEPADLVIASGGARELFFELVGKDSLPEDFRRRTRLSHHSFGGAAPVMGRPGAPYRTPVEGLWFVGAQSRSGAGLNNVMHGVWQALNEIRKSLSG